MRLSLFRDLQLSFLMRQKGELRAGGKVSGLDWLHKKLAVSLEVMEEIL